MTSAFGGQAQAFEKICSGLSRPFLRRELQLISFAEPLLWVFELVSTWSLNGR